MTQDNAQAKTFLILKYGESLTALRRMYEIKVLLEESERLQKEIVVEYKILDEYFMGKNV